MEAEADKELESWKSLLANIVTDGYSLSTLRKSSFVWQEFWMNI